MDTPNGVGVGVALPPRRVRNLQGVARDNVRERCEEWNRETWGKLQYKLERHGTLSPFEQELKDDCWRAVHWYSMGYEAGDAVELEPFPPSPPLPVVQSRRQIADEQETTARYWIERMERMRAEEAAKPQPAQTELIPRNPWDIPRAAGKRRKGKRQHGGQQ